MKTQWQLSLSSQVAGVGMTIRQRCCGVVSWMRLWHKMYVARVLMTFAVLPATVSNV